METFVGIDGGGTGATAVAVDARGRELARLRGPALLVRATDPAAGAAALADLVDRVLRAAAARPPAAGFCCALAGAGREPERRALAAALHREAIAIRVRITTDADAAFHDAFGDGPGLLLVAGTGSIARGRAPDGRDARAGGWGALLGDEGSGYALGLAALRAAARAHDGRGPVTTLLDAALAHAGVDAAEGLIAWADRAAKAEIAALAPAVAAAALAGDDVAASLVHAAAHELALHVAALHRALGPWDPPAGLALAGGLLVPGRPLRAETVAAIERLDTPIRVLEREVDAARGAADLARDA